MSERRSRPLRHRAMSVPRGASAQVAFCSWRKSSSADTRAPHLRTAAAGAPDASTAARKPQRTRAWHPPAQKRTPPRFSGAARAAAGRKPGSGAPWRRGTGIRARALPALSLRGALDPRAVSRESKTTTWLKSIGSKCRRCIAARACSRCDCTITVKCRSVRHDSWRHSRSSAAKIWLGRTAAGMFGSNKKLHGTARNVQPGGAISARRDQSCRSRACKKRLASAAVQIGSSAANVWR